MHVSKHTASSSLFLGSPWDGSLLLAHRGHQFVAWGAARRRLRGHPQGCPRKAYETQMPDDAPILSFGRTPILLFGWRLFFYDFNTEHLII